LFAKNEKWQMKNLLEVKHLTIDFDTENGQFRAVNDISFSIAKGEILGIVGESGSGKSVTSLSLMQLLPQPPAKYSAGEILFTEDGKETVNLLSLDKDEIRAYRGASLAMIFQEPMTSLNPVFKCGLQVTEAIQLHQKVDFETAKVKTLELFEKVKLPDPNRMFESYPHQLSGGQKQRVMIAMAMSCEPSILIADEPTTALDVTVQRTILDLMLELKAQTGMSMIFISHDLGVISELCDRVLVMHKGIIVEQGAVKDIFQNPKHPYTQGLVACRPSLKHKLHRLPTVQNYLLDGYFEAKIITSEEIQARQTALYAQKPLLKVENVSVKYPSKKNWYGKTTEWLHAVNQVNFEVFPGESFGLVGESGCGKTTLGRSIARLNDISAGEIWYENQNISALSASEMRPLRREIQLIFQDPYASLNPRMRIGAAIQEPMQVHKLHDNDTQRKAKVIDLLETVGLTADQYNRYPHEFSGGQRQRICIARALALEPRFIICDEIVSALDVSVQATVLNLLVDLREKFGLTYLFISHDLSVVKQLCDRMMVMNKGKIEEIGFPEDIYANPSTDYVRKLIGAIPGQ
jgi:peptide/nickel transport system ATP-binding protein